MVRDGLVIVRDPRQREIYTLPADSHWVVSCGFGLTVRFGAAPDGDHDDVGSLVDVSLTRLFLLSRSLCDDLGPHVGKTVLGILAGN